MIINFLIIIQVEMNIAIISTNLNDGEAERIAGELSKELSKKYNVYVFLFSIENIVYEYGGTIVNIGHNGPFYEYAIKIFKEKYDIDVAISFLEIMNFANIRTRGKERVIISERSVQSLCEPLHYSEVERIKRYYNHADEIVACSYGVKYDLEHNYDVKNDISVVYNLINKKTIIQKSEQDIDDEIIEFLEGKEFFLNVGQLHKQKDQVKLIDQFSVFAQNNNEYKMLILGSGELNGDLEKQIKNLHMENKIKIIPYTENPFMYMKRAKALVLSSYYEGLQNVILEAMTINIPIIASDCLAGSRELLNDEDNYSIVSKKITLGKRGILVPDSEKENLGLSTFMADAMKIVASDKAYCEYIVNNQKIYMNDYDNETLLKQWVSIIEKNDRKNIDVLKDENERLTKSEKKYIYGAGNVGKAFYVRLSKKCKIDGFIVTKKSQDNDYLFGVPIYEVDVLDDNLKDVAIIIGVSDNLQGDIIKTLKEKGLDNFVYPFIEPCTYDYYYNNCDSINIRDELIDWYRSITGKDIDIDNPKTFNEKIQWLKLYDVLPEKTILADKLLVRNYVKEKIGEKYLIPILGVWDSYENIEFDKLPQKFALKCNTGSGTNVIINDKSNMNHMEYSLKFNEWKNIKYEYVSGLEMHYSGMKSKVYAEKLLETENGEDLYDYKVFVFNGKAKLIQVDIDRHHNHRRNLYTPEWDYLPYTILYSTAPDVYVPKPKCLDELLNISEILGEKFIHVRVDFYICKDRIYFGEMTFSHGSGTEKFIPEEFDYEMGEWMKLESR